MAGLLGDVYSAIDSKKRQLKGLLADPVETVRQFMFNQNQDAGKSLDLLGQTYKDANGKPSLANMSPRSQAAHDKLTSDLTAAVMGATVWHGSPHKFDKFDSSKIGTGEGAQAYGHGLYLADSPAVAQQYAGMNPSSSVRVLPNGKQFDVVATRDSGPLEELGTFASRAEADKVASGFTGSNHYKVDLPDEHIAKMLDWDKPLSGQEEAMASLGAALDQTKIGNALGVYRGKIPQTSLTSDRIFGGTQGAAAGSDLYRALANASTHDEAAALLRKQGIPGIRYLDGGSRGAGTGSSNYVVFPGNEGLLSIMERNGQPLK